MGALAVIWAPARTLSRVAEEQRVLLGFGVVALYAALSLVGGSIAIFGGLTQAQFETGGAELPSGFEDFVAYAGVFALILAVVQPFVLWLLVSGLMQLVTRFFGGTGPFSGMLAVVGVAQVPLVISVLIQIPITGLQVVLGPPDPASGDPVATILGLLSSLLGLAFLIWFAALVVIGAAFARSVGYGQSAGSCAISCAGCAGLILIVILVIVVVVVAIVGVAGSGAPS
ncbi:MAG: YIP1 family protein [Actinomycetota bacterium]|nr:YIP1 family protein [Actinomycetota bacterium]